MISPDKLKTSVVIRLNQGMLRDCWWEDDTLNPDQRVFVLRQVSMIKTEAVKAKEIRLTCAEAEQVAAEILKGIKR